MLTDYAISEKVADLRTGVSLAMAALLEVVVDLVSNAASTIFAIFATTALLAINAHLGMVALLGMTALSAMNALSKVDAILVH